MKSELKKKTILVGISEMAISDNPDDLLATYSLGSCVGVSLFDPVNNIGALIHCMLPTAMNEQEKARHSPYMYVDTGMTKMLQQMFELGTKKSDIICKVSGAGNPLSDSNMFRIGERNYAILKKILWKNNILIKGELVGDKTAKTMFLHMDTGKTYIRISGLGDIEI